VCRTDHAANRHFLVAIFSKVAYIVSIRAQAQECKPALIVWHIRWTYIEEAGTVSQFYDVVNVRA
jgi:hypothetical protein